MRRHQRLSSLQAAAVGNVTSAFVAAAAAAATAEATVLIPEVIRHTAGVGPGGVTADAASVSRSTKAPGRLLTGRGGRRRCRRPLLLQQLLLL